MNNNDIVTRLREQLGNDAELFVLMDDAADEIERLREQVAALNMVNWSYKEMVNEEYEDE